MAKMKRYGDLILFFYFFFKRFYLFIPERPTEREAKTQAEREKQAPCREPNVGLDPGTSGSCPGPKAGAKPLSHPRVLEDLIFLWGCYSYISEQ